MPKAPKKKLPLEHMLAIMNDPDVSAERRDRMAIAAAPYCHPRMMDFKPGKKEHQFAAAVNAGGTDTEWAGDLQFHTPN